MYVPATETGLQRYYKKRILQIFLPFFATFAEFYKASPYRPMDIDLLSKMVKELILDSDEVSLPGVGTFVAELVPSTFSDKGYTINPPYRRLYFRQRQNDADTALVDFYATSNDTEPSTAKRIVTDFLSELRQTLQEKKVVVLPGLGRLRATRENNFFFIPNEDLDIYPAGFGLEPVSLKTHEETEDEISVAVANLGALIDFPATELELADEEEAEEDQPQEPGAETKDVGEPAVEPVPENVATEPQPATLCEGTANEKDATPEEGMPEGKSTEWEEGVENEDKKGGAARKILTALLIVLTVAVVLFATFMLLAKFAPSTLDHILYTQEQLDIINYKL